jgi:hypothetical protein
MIKTREQMGFFITDKEIANKIMQSQDRRIAFAERRMIAIDKLKEPLSKKLSNIFSIETYTDALPYLDLSSNLMKKLMGEVSTVYTQEPTREVSPKGSEKLYNEITGIEGFDINGKFQKCNYLLNCLNDLVFQAITVDGEFDLAVITPDRLVVWEHPSLPHVAEALMIEDSYYDEKGQKQTQWLFWSPVRHFIVRGEAKGGRMQILNVNENPEMINPYAEINNAKGTFYPFVFAHNSTREESFFDENSGNDLVEATKMVGIHKTFRNMMIPMQFKQIAVKMPMEEGKSLKNNQLKSPLHVFQSNGDMTVLDWQSNIEALGREIQNYMFEIASAYGVSQDQFKLTASPQSGFALKISKERLLELREMQNKIWRKIENDVFELAKETTNLYPDFKGIAPAAKFSIDFAEYEVAEDPIVELDVFQRKIELGVISLIDVVKKYNPDIDSDEKAMEFLKKNNEIKRKIGDRFGLSNLTLKGGNDDNSGETRSQAIQRRIAE